MDTKVIIPNEIKDNLSKSDIAIIKKEIEDTQYNIIKYACRIDGNDMFIVTFEKRPRYCGFPPIISLSPKKDITWHQDIDAYITVLSEAEKQAKSVFRPL